LPSPKAECCCLKAKVTNSRNIKDFFYMGFNEFRGIFLIIWIFTWGKFNVFESTISIINLVRHDETVAIENQRFIGFARAYSG
jgi:hypothetical protein